MDIFLLSEPPTIFIRSRHDDNPPVSKTMPEFDPDSLVGRTFPEENGERFRAKVTQKVMKIIEDQEGKSVD